MCSPVRYWISTDVSPSVQTVQWCTCVQSAALLYSCVESRNIDNDANSDYNWIFYTFNVPKEPMQTHFLLLFWICIECIFINMVNARTKLSLCWNNLHQEVSRTEVWDEEVLVKTKSKLLSSFQHVTPREWCWLKLVIKFFYSF